MSSSVNNDKNTWDLIIRPGTSMMNSQMKEIWKYRDLITLMVKRDIVSVYKQTILGPFWMIIQPIFVALIYTFTFSATAKLSTDGIPPLLFYLMGQTFWNYFSDCLNKTSSTFIANAAVFGKVYFPRMVMPISVMLSGLIKLGLQMLLLTAFYFYFYFTEGSFSIQWPYILLLPVFILLLGIFSLSMGIIFSSFTTKYRDLTFLLGFGIQLLMFLSFVTFPASQFSAFPTIQKIMLCNPVGSIVEAIKFTLTGHGIFSGTYLLIAVGITFFSLFISVLIFSRTERSFMDTV